MALSERSSGDSGSDQSESVRLREAADVLADALERVLPYVHALPHVEHSPPHDRARAALDAYRLAFDEDRRG
jgi:hypothetical protein